MESRLIELETKVTYQERTVATLHEALAEQQVLLGDLLRRLGRVEAQLLASAGDGGPRPAEEPPPPRY